MVYSIDQIRRSAAPIAAAYGVQSMHLFGSYARGEATEDSDVDLLIDRGSIRSGFVLGGLYADLRDGLKKRTGFGYAARSRSFLSETHSRG